MTHVQFNDTLQHGRILRRSLQQLEDGLSTLNEILATMTMMINGDGSQSSQFVEVTNRFGFTDEVTSQAAWNELNSLASKLNTDANVTAVHAAMIQAFNKFR